MKNLIVFFLLTMVMAGCQRRNMESEPESLPSSLYFPPVKGDTWETLSPDLLGWNTAELDELKEFLVGNNTRSFIILKDGKMVVEEYWGKTLLGRPFGRDSRWYWASAGKSLKAMLVGQAREDGFLSFEDPSSKYLGKGWTSAEPYKEDQITILHQLTMTTGLDDRGDEHDCLEPECLKYKADAGTRWAYHNPPYYLLNDVITGATGEDFEQYFNKRLRDPIGMKGSWRQFRKYNMYFSDARSMARYGLLVLNNGSWDGKDIIADKSFMYDMTHPSQALNPSYGYLWWLNGQSQVKYPGVQMSFNRSLAPSAPSDMIAAMGANGQIINVIPSQNLIIVRMGENPDQSLVPAQFQDDMWKLLNKVINA